MNTTVAFRLGTDNQTQYANRLLRESPYQTLLDASADLLDRDPDVLLETPPSVEEASRVISALENLQPRLEKVGASPRPEGTRGNRRASRADTVAPTPAASATPPDVAPAAAPSPARPPATTKREGARFLTARHLRQIATGHRAKPESLDDDAVWVLDRLAKALQVEAIFVPPPVVPVNGTEPISIEHLKAVFGDIEAIASTLGVSVPTVKSWGNLLPEMYSWKVEGLSHGRLRVPR